MNYVDYIIMMDEGKYTFSYITLSFAILNIISGLAGLFLSASGAITNFHKKYVGYKIVKTIQHIGMVVCAVGLLSQAIRDWSYVFEIHSFRDSEFIYYRGKELGLAILGAGFMVWLYFLKTNKKRDYV
jgi:hypothetical protein